MKHLLRFIEHSLDGAAQILAVTLMAIALHFIVRWTEVTGSAIIVYGLKGTEYLMFVFDILLVATHLIKSFTKLIKEIWKS